MKIIVIESIGHSTLFDILTKGVTESSLVIIQKDITEQRPKNEELLGLLITRNNLVEIDILSRQRIDVGNSVKHHKLVPKKISTRKVTGKGFGAQRKVTINHKGRR